MTKAEQSATRFWTSEHRFDEIVNLIARHYNDSADWLTTQKEIANEMELAYRCWRDQLIGDLEYGTATDVVSDVRHLILTIGSADNVDWLTIAVDVVETARIANEDTLNTLR